MFTGGTGGGPAVALVTVSSSKLIQFVLPAGASNQIFTVCGPDDSVCVNFTVDHVFQSLVAARVWFAATTIPSTSILRRARPLPAE